jgi:hypothetical protein
MDATRDENQKRLLSEHQRVLALSVMRGAIRRLEEKLGQDCREVPTEIRTIDSFALLLLNRWRGAIGFSRPVVPTSEDNSFEGAFHSHLTFERICQEAATLLKSSTVGKLIGLSYPIIVIDEFQDCYGPKLDLVKQLARHSQLLASADEFQLLDEIEGCPAVEWILEAEASGASVTTLTESHRCSVRSIISAAKALRYNTPSGERTIPVYCCPKWRMAATKLIFHKPTGNLALISPTHKPISGILNDYDRQLREKAWPPIYWRRETSRYDETAALLKELALDDRSESMWSVPAAQLSASAQRTVQFILRATRLRGLCNIPTSFAASLAEKFMSDHASWEHAAKRAALTVHGAKNREFDNVVILWDSYGLQKWSEEKRRRSLYNAVTRAKRSCIVLYLGDEKRCKNDPVVHLLGSAEPAFPKKEKRTSRTKGR